MGRDLKSGTPEYEVELVLPWPRYSIDLLLRTIKHYFTFVVFRKATSRYCVAYQDAMQRPNFTWLILLLPQISRNRSYFEADFFVLIFNLVPNIRYSFRYTSRPLLTLILTIK